MSSHGPTHFFTAICSMILTVMLLGCTAKETFLLGHASTGSLSDEHRQQLLQLYSQHVLKVNRQHGGVTRIEFTRAERDTALNVMQVFLKMSFGDATDEEVMVPMVLTNDKWYMK